MKNAFTKKIAKEVALISFGYVLDGLLGYGDMNYTMGEEVSVFEQNFTEDLEEMNIIVTPKRIKEVNEQYLILKKDFENMVRTKYKYLYSKKTKP